jgi:hypothetical protein
MKSEYESGKAFTDLVRDYFPYRPEGCSDFASDLYKFCRNPLAHSAGVLDAEKPIVWFKRSFDQSHPESGWTDRELNDLERPNSPFKHPHPGIISDGTNWTLHCDSFYLDVINILVRLTENAAEMNAAEQRFKSGVINWRVRPTPKKKKPATA